MIKWPRLIFARAISVVIKRSGDVIPYVIGPRARARATAAKRRFCRRTPARFCNATAPGSARAGAIDWFCPNQTCPERSHANAGILCVPRRHGYRRHGSADDRPLLIETCASYRTKPISSPWQAEPLLALDGFAEKKVENLAHFDRNSQNTVLRTSADIAGDRWRGINRGRTAHRQFRFHEPSLLETAAQIRDAEAAVIRQMRNSAASPGRKHDDDPRSRQGLSARL